MSASLRRIGLGLRNRLLRVLLITTVAGTAVYGALGAIGFFPGRLFPWDAIWLLAVCALCWVLLRRAQVGAAAGLFAVGITLPVVVATQLYGISSPVTALFLPGFIVGSLIIGSRRWLGVMVLLYGWIALAGWAELAGWWVPRQPVVRIEEWVRTVFVWWFVFTSTGGLSWIFARHLERAVELARRQTAALAHTVDALTSPVAGRNSVDAPVRSTGNVEHHVSDRPAGSSVPFVSNKPTGSAGPAPLAEPTGHEALLGQVLTAIAEQLNARWVTLWLYHRDEGLLAMELVYENGVIRPPDPARDHNSVLRPSEQDVPYWAEMVRTRAPIVVMDIAVDPRLVNRAALLAEGVRSLTMVPLVEGDDVTGWFAIRGTQPPRFGTEEIELAQALAQQVTLAVKLARLAEQEQEAMLANERNRMAREIHDTLAQGFTGIVVQLEAAEDALADGATQAAEGHLTKARTLARESLAEARRSVMALRPLMLERYDLPSALRASAMALAADTGIALEMRLAGRLPRLAPDMEADLLRIGQEAVTNAVKYAQATKLRITLGPRSDGVELEVRDNGRGFDVAAAASQAEAADVRPTRWGLVGMRERVARYGVKLTVESGADGTRVVAWLPLGESGGKEGDRSVAAVERANS